MVIIEDTKQKVGKHLYKNRQMEKLGVEVIRFKLPVGDYVLADSRIMELIKKGDKKVKANDLLPYITLSIDTKIGLNEINGDVTVQHERFRRELVKAKENGIRLIILCEGEPYVRTMEDVYFWENEHYNGSPYSTTGPKLYKSLCTIQEQYGAEFMFCSRKDTGRIIVELLGGEPVDSGRD